MLITTLYGSTPLDIDMDGDEIIEISIDGTRAKVMYSVLVAALQKLRTPLKNDILGQTARVIAKIAPNHPGEIRVGVRGGTEDYIAVSDQIHLVNDLVYVAEVHPPRTATVRNLQPS